MLRIRVDTPDTVRLDGLLRHIAPSVPEVPYDMALDMLRQAYTEFARKTQLLVSHVTLGIQKGVRVYDIPPPEGYDTFAILHPHNYHCYPNPHTWCAGWGTDFRVLNSRVIELRTAPSQDYADREIALHLIPNACIDTIPQEVATPFGKGIAMGALSDMLEIPNQPWYNPRLAQAKKIEFNQAALTGRELAMTNRGHAKLTMKPVRFV